MLLYRIQNENNEGPFVGWYAPSDRRVYGDWERANRNPCPTADGLRWFRGTACACLKEQLRYWWTRQLYRDMRKQGFRLVVIEVPDTAVRVGRTQAVYEYQLATLHRRWK